MMAGSPDDRLFELKTWFGSYVVVQVIGSNSGRFWLTCREPSGTRPIPPLVWQSRRVSGYSPASLTELSGGTGGRTGGPARGPPPGGGEGGAGNQQGRGGGRGG